MRISERSRTDFARAKIKLTGHFDRRPTVNISLAVILSLINRAALTFWGVPGQNSLLGPLPPPPLVYGYSSL